jgi:hypothetical protein
MSLIKLKADEAYSCAEIVRAFPVTTCGNCGPNEWKICLFHENGSTRLTPGRQGVDRLEDSSINIPNILGRVIPHFQRREGSSAAVQLSLLHYSSGIYRVSNNYEMIPNCSFQL